MKEWFSLTLPKYTAVTNIKSNSGKETNQYKTKKTLKTRKHYKIILILQITDVTKWMYISTVEPQWWNLV